MKKIYISVIFVLSIFVSSEIYATSYYVDPVNGSDSNAGTEALPFKTLTKANTAAVAGDTVFLRGGQYDCAITGNLKPQNSGAANAKIVYQNYQGEKPVITNANATDNNYAIDLTNRSHITIKGIEVNGYKLYEQSNCDHWLLLNNSTYTIIDGCSFFYAKGWDGVLFDNHSNYNQIINCEFDYCGTWDTEGLWRPSTSASDNGGKPANDSGDLLWISCGQFNLIENCKFRHGGHDMIVVDDRYNVIRNNDFNNNWSEHAANQGEYIGARAGAFTGRQNKTCLGGGISEQAMGGYNLIENNIFTGAGWNPDAYRNTPVGLKLEGLSQIFRFNRVGNTNGTAVSTTTRDVNPHASKNKLYNNVIFNSYWGGWRLRDYDDPGSVSAQENVCLNNIFYKNRNYPQNFAGEYSDFNDCDISIWLIWLEASKRDDNQIHHNLIFNGSEKPAKLYVKNEGNRNDLTWFNDNNDNVFSNIEDDPMFQSNLDIYDVNTFKLHPQSPAIDKGSGLTKTTSSGSGTVIPVAYPEFFFATRFTIDNAVRQYDDFGGKLVSDKIRIRNQDVRITSIDYDAGTISVDQAITWNEGDEISLPYKGSAPDMGLFDYENTGGNSAPIINAGFDTSIEFPIDAVLLKGSVIDDNLPEGKGVTTVWRLKTGPAEVTIVDSINIETVVKFTMPGEYVFEFEANDSELKTVDEVKVTVLPKEEILLDAYYNFNEGEGTTINDTSGNQHHAKNYGAEWVGGKVGSHAAYFNGDPDGKVVGDSIIAEGYKGITGDRSRTITAWVRINTHGTIISYGDKTVNGALWTLRIDNSTYALRLEVTGGFIRGTTALNDNVWHHVAVSFKNDSDPNVTDAKLFVDGVEEVISSSSPVAINTGTKLDVMIGTNAFGRHLNGLIDELRIYSGAMNADKIKTSVVSSIKDLKEQKSAIQCWPNPTSDFINIQFIEPTRDATQLELRDISGKIIKSWSLNTGFPAGHQQLNIKNQKSGIYIFRVKIGNQLVENYKIVKQ